MDILYPLLLTLHNFNRWLLLLAAVWAVAASLGGLRSGAAFTAAQRRPVSLLMGSAHLQLLLGLLLFALLGMGGIPVFAGARPSFQWEHMALGVLAATFATLAAVLGRRAPNDAGRFRVVVTWGGLTLLLALLAIPWWRPLLRLFSA